MSKTTLSALPIKEAKEYTAEARQSGPSYLLKDAEKFFTTFKFPKDWKLSRNKYRLYIPLSSNATYDKVKNELPSSFKLSYDDYVNNQAIEVIETQRGKKERPIKLGKLLHQLGKDELVKEVAADKARESKASDRYVVISRHPYDIAGMTSDRDWETTSCMSIPTKKIEYARKDNIAKLRIKNSYSLNKTDNFTKFNIVMEIDGLLYYNEQIRIIRNIEKIDGSSLNDFLLTNSFKISDDLDIYLENESYRQKLIILKDFLEIIRETIEKAKFEQKDVDFPISHYIMKDIAPYNLFNKYFDVSEPANWIDTIYKGKVKIKAEDLNNLIFISIDIAFFYLFKAYYRYSDTLILCYENAHRVDYETINYLKLLASGIFATIDNDKFIEYNFYRINGYGFRKFLNPIMSEVDAVLYADTMIEIQDLLLPFYLDWDKDFETIELAFKTLSSYEKLFTFAFNSNNKNHNGAYHHKVKDSCKFSLIAYEIKGNDLNIRRPLGRKLINTYKDYSIDARLDDYILVPASRSYGSFSEDAASKVNEFCALFNKNKVVYNTLFKEPRSYDFHHDLYNDRNDENFIYSPMGDSVKETQQIFEEIKQAYYSKKNKKGEVFDLIKLIQIRDRLKKAKNDQKAIELMNLLNEFINNLNSKNTNQNLIKGFNTFVSTPKQDYKGYFALTELDYLQTSNLPEQDFRPNPNYPADCQTRQYYANRNENDVIQAILHKFKPQHVINDSPDAVTGTPVVSGNGIVLGGNKRAMILKSLRYEQYETYLSLLKQKIYCFGITEKEIYNFKKPVLVRVIEDFDITKCSEISYQLNKDNSVKYSPLQEGISASRTLKENKYASDKLLAIIEEHDFETIAELFDNNKAVKGIIGILIEIGIFNNVNKAMYVSDSGLLTGAGEDFVQFMFLGTVIKDKVVLENAKNFANKIIKTLHLIFKISEYPKKYDINKHIQFAMKMEAERKINNMSISQVGILKKLFEDDEIPPEAVYLYLLLNSTTANQYIWKEFLLYYTKRVDYLIAQSQTGNVFGKESEQDLEALDIIKEFNKNRAEDINKFIGAKSERQKAFTAIKGRFGLSDKTNISQVDKYQDRIERSIRFILANEYDNLGVYFKDKRVIVADLDKQRPIAIIDLEWNEDAHRLKAHAQIGIVDINGNTFTKEEEMIAREIARQIEFITKIAHKKAKTKAVFTRSERLFNSEQEKIDLTKTKEYKKLGLDITPLFDETENELNKLGFERIIPESRFEYENNEMLVFHKNKLLAKINLHNFVITYKSDLYNKEIKQIREILKARTNENLRSNYKSLQQLGNYENNNFILLDDLNNAVFKAIPQNFSMLIWGSAGGGKSTLALNLLKDLGAYGKALYFTSEERFENATITKKLELIGAEGENIWFEDTNDVNRLYKAARSKQFKFIVIDSVNMLQLKDNELIDLIKSSTGTNFILISHSTKDKRSHKGDSMLEFYPDIVVKVVNGVAELTKNRFAKADTEAIKIFDYFNKNEE